MAGSCGWSPSIERESARERVSERDRDRDRDRDRETGRERESECVCVRERWCEVERRAVMPVVLADRSPSTSHHLSLTLTHSLTLSVVLAAAW
jgi:hypothetical protein